MKLTSNTRFIVAPDALLDQAGEQLIILSDLQYWNANYDALQHWCANNNSSVSGMVVSLASCQDLTAFCLRWS